MKPGFIEVIVVAPSSYGKKQAVGFFGGKRRYAGDRFEVPDKTIMPKSGWFVPFDPEKAKPKAEDYKPEPTALSELAKGTARRNVGLEGK